MSPPRACYALVLSHLQERLNHIPQVLTTFHGCQCRWVKSFERQSGQDFSSDVRAIVLPSESLKKAIQISTLPILAIMCGSRRVSTEALFSSAKDALMSSTAK